MPNRTTRRDFVKTSAALGTAWWVGARPGLAQDSTSANEQMQVASIGVGGKGDGDARAANQFNQTIALCDVDEKNLNKMSARLTKVPKENLFVDFREMFDKLGDKIDICTVSTPDHTHFAATAMALKHGAHCYTQKPLTWSIDEARMLREMAAKTGLATQMGNQGTANRALREAVEVIQSGGLGAVNEVHVWTNRPIWPQGMGRPEDAQKVPDGFHWDLWLGPAPEREYHSAYAPFKWRGWLDFGTGALGDMACHTANMPVMGLQLFGPDSVVAEHTGLEQNETYPKSSTITFQFPERDNPHGGKFAPCSMTWYDGGRKPTEVLEKFGLTKTPSSGCLVIGEKTSIYSGDVYCGKYQFVGGEPAKIPEQWLPRAGSHEGEFHEYCKDPSNPEKKALSNFDYAGRLTQTILLGNTAMRMGSGEKLMWNEEKGKFENEEANKFLGREYREGWEVG